MTGLSVVDDWNGFAYITSNYQHPSEGVANLKMKDKELQAELISLIDPFAAGVGYVGGIPGVANPGS